MSHNTTILRSIVWITLVSIILLASAYPTISEAKLGNLFKPLSFTSEPRGIKPQRSFADERLSPATSRAPVVAFAQPSSTSIISYPLSKGIAGYSDLFGFLGVANVATPGIRALRVVGNTLTAGQQGTVSIEFDSQGDENAVGFSINFDRSKLTYVKTTKGAGALAAGATLNTNPNLATPLPVGHLGYALAVDAGTTFTAGTLQLVVVTFNVAASGSGMSDVTFGDLPIPHEITDDGHTGSILILPADYTLGTVTINALAPTVTSLSPVSAITGAPAFTLTVNGAGFASSSVVRINGSNRPTTFINTTQLSALIDASDIQASGSFPIDVATPAPGGGVSASINLEVGNPVPVLTSIDPLSATAGAGAFTLTISGSNFIGASVVKVNGSDRTTTFISGSQLTAEIPASDIQTAGTAGVAVFNPTPAGGSSSPAALTINNPLPVLGTVLPATAIVGGASLTVEVNGSSFVNGSVVRFNGSDCVTSFISSSQLTAQITAADIQSTGAFPITVFNPAPGGGASAAVDFAVNNPTPVLDVLLPTSAIVGGGPFTLTVNGSSFVNGSVVRFNGSDRATTFGSNTQLTAEITAADIQATGTSLITIFNPTPGGGASGAVDFNVNNPVPVLASIAPASKLTGDDAFTLTVTGTNFVNGAVVRLNGSDRATTFVDATQLTAQVSAADLQSAGAISVTVFNLLPGGGTSGAVDLNVSNPAPVLASITPVSATVGGVAFTLTVNGSSFVNGSVVKFNGSDRTTTFASSTQLTADLTAADLTQAGTFSVTVFNPTPAGGTSTAVDFTVNNTQPVVSGVSPANITVGGVAFSLAIDGTGFVSGSVVRLGGSDRTTVFLSSTQLTAQITAADIQTTGTLAITIFNPTPGGGTSAAVDLHVNNPVPVLTSLSPTNKAAGGDAFTLTVTGTDFVNGAVVRLNGNARSTTFVNASELTAQISVANISTVGALAVTVLNPTPGGGISNSVNLTVDPPAPGARALRAVNVIANPGTTVNVSIEIVSQGDENSLGFSLSFDPTQLVFVSATQGADATNASLVVNGGAATDHVGIAEVLPAGTAFSTGVHPVVTVAFTVPASGNATSTEVKFDDFPVLREVVNTDASGFLQTAYSSGVVTIAQGYEADVTPRPNGNQGICTPGDQACMNSQVTALDFSQVGLFIAHLDEATLGSEFQRADCAPRSTKGDGRLSVADWTQAGRYAAALDDVVFAGGPMGPVTQPTSPATASVANLANMDQEMAASVVRISTGQFSAGQTSSVSVELDARGNENALGFSLMFNPAAMSFISAQKGSDASDAALQVNKVNSSKGRVGIALAMPAERAFDAGRHQVVTVTFAVRSDGEDAATPVFSDLPIDREVVDVRATPIKADFVKEKADEKNPIDDAQFFVTQHYQDFLSRKPDLGGLDYWTEQIAQCGTDAACVHDRRIGVSAAFFIEQEFQQTGSVVYRLYKAAYGQRPTYAQFSTARSQLIGGDQLPASTLEFANRFVGGAEFKQAYPDSLSPTAFINKLYERAGLSQQATEKLQAAQDMSTQSKTRAQVLLELIGTREFKDREYNSAFVLMQYFGYLQRDADQDGYDFWLNVLNNKEPGNYRGMVCSFITSQEYQHRFGSAVTHTNAECGQ